MLAAYYEGQPKLQQQQQQLLLLLPAGLISWTL
jgi:hypothetical protein